MEALGLILIVLGVIVYNAFAWGYVASVFYGWFVLPSFPTLPHFGYVEFIGFLLFIGVMTHKSSTNIKDEYKDTGMDTLQLLIGPWISLFLGWLVHIVFF